MEGAGETVCVEAVRLWRLWLVEDAGETVCVEVMWLWRLWLPGGEKVCVEAV